MILRYSHLVFLLLAINTRLTVPFYLIGSTGTLGSYISMIDQFDEINPHPNVRSFADGLTFEKRRSLSTIDQLALVQ